MEVNNNIKFGLTEEQRYYLAKKRIKEIKDYYRHLASYIIVNIFISIVIIVGRMNGGGESLIEVLDFKTFSVWIFWGIGMFFHTIGVFGVGIKFGKNWEERKIREYMDKD